MKRKYYILLVALVFLTSCYTRQKAQVQHGKAVATFPEIGADYCARIYPPKDSLVKGDSIFIEKTDTLWGDGNTVIDTIYFEGKPKEIIKVVTLPGKTIIERHFRVDTLRVTNTAEVDLWKIQANKAIDIATDKTKESDKWKKLAKQRFWIIIGMGAAMALGIFAFVKKRIAKKVS